MNASEIEKTVESNLKRIKESSSINEIEECKREIISAMHSYATIHPSKSTLIDMQISGTGALEIIYQFYKSKALQEKSIYNKKDVYLAMAEILYILQF